MKYFYVLFIGTFLASSISTYSNSWILKKKSKNISVFLKNKKGSSVKMFKTQMVIAAKLSSAVSLLNDVEYIPEWIKGVIFAKRLKRYNAKASLIMTETRSPWPFQNREAIVYAVWSQNKKTKETVLSSTSKPNFIKKSKNKFRIDNIQGKWKLTPLANKKIKVVYVGHVEPGGNTPAWVINIFLVNSSIDIMTQFSEHIKKKRFSQKPMPFKF